MHEILATGRMVPNEIAKRRACVYYSHLYIFKFINIEKSKITLPETNIAPKNGWLEYYCPIGEAYFQGRTVSFREGKCICIYVKHMFFFVTDYPMIQSTSWNPSGFGYDKFQAISPYNAVEKSHAKIFP